MLSNKTSNKHETGIILSFAICIINTLTKSTGKLTTTIQQRRLLEEAPLKTEQKNEHIRKKQKHS